MSQTIRNVARAGMLLAVVAALCRVASLGKELLVAAVFGAGVQTDAFALVVIIPTMGMSVLVLAVRSAFLTQYPRVVEQQPTESGEFVRYFLTTLLLASTGFAALAAVVLSGVWPWFIASDASQEMEISRQLVAPAAWTLVPIAAVAGLTAVLNARGRFAWPQATAVLPTLCVAVLVIVVGRSKGALVLILGLAAGSTLQALVLAAIVLRGGQSLWPKFKLSPTITGQLWRFAGPLVLLGLLAQANVFVDRAMASTLATGSVAVLGWAGTIYDLLTGTMIGSFLWVLLPYFSQQAAEHDYAGLQRSVSLILQYAAALLFPLSAVIVVVCPVLFAHFSLGQLDRQASAGIGACLAAYGLGLFATLAGTAMYQALLSLGRLRALLAVAIVGSLLPNLALNLLLIGPLGEVGLALATSLVAWLVLAANGWLLRREVGGEGTQNTRRVVLCSLFASTLAAGAWLNCPAVATRIWPELAGADLAGLAVGAPLAVGVYIGALLFLPGGRDVRSILRTSAAWLLRRGEFGN